MTRATFTYWLPTTTPNGEETEVEVEVDCRGRIYLDYGHEGPYGSTYAVQHPRGIPCCEDADITSICELHGDREWRYADLDRETQADLQERACKALEEGF